MNRLRDFTERPPPPSLQPHNGAEWVTRAHIRRLTPEEQQALFAWLGAAPKCRGRDYLRAETMWLLSGGLSAYADVRAEVANLMALPAPHRPAVPLRTHTEEPE